MCGGIDTCIVVDATSSCTDTVIVTIWENPYPGLILNVTNESCVGCCDGLISALSGGLYYVWSNSPSNFSVDSNLCAGTYTVTVYDFEGCTASASATVGGIGNCSASFAMYPSSPQNYWVVNSSTGAAPISYDWDWGDGSPHDAIAFPTHTYAAAGIYNISLSITDGVGCTNMQVFNSYLARMEQILTVTVVPNLPTSAAYDDSQIIVSLFPNPLITEVTLNFGKEAFYDVQLCNTFGEMLKQTQINSSVLSLNMSSYAKGIYFITVTDEAGNKAVRKVVKM
ncbi:MAG: T9SS type A sorting domain-containing protein [Bacteroidia bacterium]|nr:T9SS type A sorting domain-containing protein [Bacteroidia bacterium]